LRPHRARNSGFELGPSVKTLLAWSPAPPDVVREAARERDVWAAAQSGSGSTRIEPRGPLSDLRGPLPSVAGYRSTVMATLPRTCPASSCRTASGASSSE
jgi:hypothetical protein